MEIVGSGGSSRQFLGSVGTVGKVEGFVVTLNLGTVDYPLTLGCRPLFVGFNHSWKVAL